MTDKYELSKYQEDAIESALRIPKYAWFLPTGSGKTLCALLYLQVLDRPAIIIAPASIKHVWLEENEKFGLNLNISTHYGSPAPILLVSYDWVKYNVEALEDFDVVVFDEAHCIADVETDRYKYISKAIKDKTRILLLAGYPVENRMNEIFVLSLITDILGKNYYHFLYKYFNVIRHNGRIIKTVPKRGSFDLIINQIKDCVYITPKSNVVDESVKKETVIVRFALSEKQKEMINALAEFGSYHDSKMTLHCKNALAVYGKILQIISGFVYITDDDSELCPIPIEGVNPKLEMLHKIIDGKRNFLLWHIFDFEKEMLHKYESQCRVSKIQTDSRGLNLQHYDFAVYFSMPLSGGMYMQSVDRLYRRGREKDVISVVLIPEGEFGTKLLQLLDRKQKLTNKFISELLRVKA